MNVGKETESVALGPERCQLRVLSVTFVVLVIYTLVSDLGSHPYDDAYFFERIARNFLRHHTWAWNVSDGPVHGITSQLFLALTALLVQLAPHYVVASTKLLLAIFMAFTGTRLIFDSAGLTRQTVVGGTLALVAMVSPLTLTTIHTGMETALALLLLTLAIRPKAITLSSSLRSVGSGILAVLVYLTRPDATLIPLVTFALANWRRKRQLAVYVVSVGVGIGLCQVAFRSYYGTALPLPFYAKTFGHTSADPIFHKICQSSKVLHVLTFLAFAAPFLIVTWLGKNLRAISFGVAAIAFMAYHLAFTEDIMAYRARFLVPALIPLALAAAAGWDDYLARWSAKTSAVSLIIWGLVVTAGYSSGAIETGSISSVERIGLPAYLAAIVVWAQVRFLRFPRGDRLGPSLWSTIVVAAVPVAATLAALPPRLVPIVPDDTYVVRSSLDVTTFRGIFDLQRCLPGLRQVYHSEIGVPGLVLPTARVVDLAGLMSKEIALPLPHFDEYCARDMPEAIFLPHRNYSLLNQEILGGRCIHNYTRLIRNSSSPLYVRNDLVMAFQACARDLGRWQ